MLARRGTSFNDVASLATKVRSLSDFYIAHPGAPTPWDEAFAVDAYLSYFQPLNYIRLASAWREVRRFLPSEVVSGIYDFGSGSGNTHWILEAEAWAPRPLFAIEKNARASDLHLQLIGQEPCRWTVNFAKSRAAAALPPGSLAVFSYSFLEIRPTLEMLQPFDHLLILEPSTRDCSRELMTWRTTLMENGFHPLAPCTHAQACPLLTQSQKDWCHQRVPFSPPDWWHELEAHLPMTNRTLTYSYLLMSRTTENQKFRGAGRAIGDTLVENGKTRQLVCRGPQREFMSWLHKSGTPPQIPRGALIRGLDSAEVRGGGQELRLTVDALTWEE